MKRLLLLIPIISILGCSASRIFYPKDVRTYKPRAVKPSKPKDTQAHKSDNVFDAPFVNVWLATLASVKWIKWVPAFKDERTGIIRLREGYVYRKSGKLLRIYNWPPKEDLQQSAVDDYFEKVSDYKSFDFDKPVFSQESMEIRIVRLSETKIKVEIDYRIRAYLYTDKFEDGIKSSGYIESVLLERIEQNLKGEPLATR